MKKLFTIFALGLLLSCEERANETVNNETPTSNAYTQSDAVGTWKATFYQRDPEGPQWNPERNSRTLSFKTDGTFTSYNIMENGGGISGKYTIDANGYISTSNTTMPDRKLSMNLSSKTEAIFYINTSSEAITKKYKVVKQP